MKKILIIEDDPLSLELLVQLLIEKYEVLTAMDGRTGLESIKKDRPDLVLLDISLPFMDGYQVVKNKKGDPELEKTVVIGVSSRAMKADIEKAMRVGFDEYLTKPIDEDHLFKIIETYL